MSKNESGQESVDYSKTLFLPKTDFPMRAGLPKKEPEILDFWKRARRDAPSFAYPYKTDANGREVEREKFVLHDGPPYANGNLHIGHALNKVLKDIICRSHQMMGYYAPYVPGWDCHGLPIEWKIEEQYRAKGKNKDEVPLNEFRRECREFAEHWIGVQTEEFQRLGVQGDFENPYLTMAYHSEARIAGELLKFAMSGQLYRGSKPVMWSVVERTALAEAEVEYHTYESDTVWVKFPIRFVVGDGPEIQSDLLDASIVIWTTTPWTIPGNRAISFSSSISYGLYRVTSSENEFGPQPGEKFVFADKLVENCFEKAKLGFERLRSVSSETLDGINCSHPLDGYAGGYGFVVPMFDGEHVTDAAGTGFVHTAPGHGREDFEIWMAQARKKGVESSIPFTVDDAGAYTEDAPGFVGARVIDDKGKKGDANKRVIAALIEAERLFARGRVKHDYPHSWRSKKPVIFRNTPQWFVYMDEPIEGKEGDTLRARSLNAIDATRFYPESGQNRLRAMIENRPDWVLSRQRAWGVPICVFVNAKGEILKDEAVNERIIEAFESEGADAWFEEGAKARFLGNDHDPDIWDMVSDILDVWFDSGSTHTYVLEDRPELQWPADLYLEGSDQHRGWFHSSLLESCGTRGRAPYKGVLTHGFTMDQYGRKMSKSLGNTVVPQEIIKQYGADILRLWVASVDYAEDQRLGPEIIKGNVDSYRKLRNTVRWMLGALTHYEPEKDKIAYADMPELERYMLHLLHELGQTVEEGYRAYDFKRVFSALFRFMTIDLSAFYFDIRKDALYCDPLSSTRRKAALTVIDTLFDHLLRWLAPILPFSSDEAWLHRHDKLQVLEKNWEFAVLLDPGPPMDTSPEGLAAYDRGLQEMHTPPSIHARDFASPEEKWLDAALADRWTQIRKVRRVVTGALEIKRQAQEIGSSLEAAPRVYVADAALLAVVESSEFADICITSDIALLPGDGPSDAFRLDDMAGVSVEFVRAEGKKCARSWKISPDVGSEKKYPDLTPRDAQAIRELKVSGRLRRV